jgi:hypothetical protein
MATQAYMTNRRKYSRPQGVLFSENPGTLQLIDQGTENEKVLYYPDGYEVGQTLPVGGDASLSDQFIILSDHNRGPIDFSVDRIENRERMINGRMRSYHVADKLNLSLSWNMLPSRSFVGPPNFSQYGTTTYAQTEEYTADNGAGGVELLDWYNNHTDSFWVFLAYDNYKSYGEIPAAYSQLDQYSQVVEMFISSFDYSVEKRGNGTYDFWNINIRLEEV